MTRAYVVQLPVACHFTVLVSRVTVLPIKSTPRFSLFSTKK